MKLVVTTLVIAVFCGPSWARDAEFFNDANLRTRYENFMLQNGRPKDANNKEDNNQLFTTRTQLALNMRKGETIKARIMFQNNFTWGSDVEDPNVVGTPSGTGDSKPYSPDGVRDGQNLLLVNEAWLWWKLNESMALRFGRGQLRLGDGKVVSNNDYLNVPYALDGAILGWTASSVHTDFIAMKLAEYVRSGSVRRDADMNLYGFSIDFIQLPEIFSMVHLHFLQIIKDPIDSVGPQTPDVLAYKNGLNYGRYGLAVAGGQNFQFKVSYAALTGSISPVGSPDQDWQASMIDGEIGYKMKTIYNSRVTLLVHRDTGNNGGGSVSRYDGFLYDVHENAGAMDIMGFGNLTYVGATLQFDLIEDLRFSFDAYRFGRTEISDQVVPGPNGVELFTGQRGAASPDVPVGSEFDFAAEHNYENGLQMKARFSMFTPDSYLSANNGPATTISHFFLQSRIQF